MARFVKEFPMVDYQQTTFPQIQRFLNEQKYVYCHRDGEMVFQKGKGVWVAPSFIKVSYQANTVKLEAWIDAMGEEQGLDGVLGAAAKKPLKKTVAQIEQILTRPNPAYVPVEQELAVCAACGIPLKVDAKFCGSCGAPVEDPTASTVVTPAITGIPTGRRVTKKEYFEKYAGESFYRNLKILAILGYILCGILAINLLMSPLAVIDLAVYLGLVLGMHLGRSKLCAIGITAYSGFWMAFNFVAYGVLSGWGTLILGIYSIVIFHNAEKRYKKLTAEQ